MIKVVAKVSRVRFPFAVEALAGLAHALYAHRHVSIPEFTSDQGGLNKVLRVNDGV